MQKKTKTKQKGTEDKQVFIKRCSICRKRFRTCNKKRTVCDKCCEINMSEVFRRSRKNKRRFIIDQEKNDDGVSYNTKCICCGQRFVSCNNTRLKCTSCICDDMGIHPEEANGLFKIGNEPDNTMPDNLKVKCRNCSKYFSCQKRRSRKLTRCCNGSWVKCSQCVFAENCDRRISTKAEECHAGVFKRKEPDFIGGDTKEKTSVEKEEKTSG